MRVSALLAWPAVFLLPAALAAKERSPISLSPVWQLESDDEYRFEADYRPPRPVRGLALHGYLAGENLYLDSDGRIVLPTSGKCPAPVTLDDPRGLPESFPLRTDTEFWFYRSGDHGVYLSRSWMFERSAECAPVARVETRIVHMSLFNGIARFVETANGGEPEVSSVAIADDARYPILAQFVVIDDRDLNRPQGRHSRRQPVDRFEGTRLRRLCFDSSFAFLFSTSCYLVESGRWHGLLISASAEADDGSGYQEYGLSELNPRASLDGRLFEWGRKITLAPAAERKEGD